MTEGLKPAAFGATIRRHRLPHVAARCRTALSKAFPLLRVADRLCVCAEWCQKWCQCSPCVCATLPTNRNSGTQSCGPRPCAVPSLVCAPLQREDGRAVADVPVGHRRLYRKDVQAGSPLGGLARMAGPSLLISSVRATPPPERWYPLRTSRGEVLRARESAAGSGHPRYVLPQGRCLPPILCAVRASRLRSGCP